MSKKTTPSVLVIDIGNTSTSLGVLKGERVQRVHRIEKIDQSEDRIADVLNKTLGGDSVDGVAIASVVPLLNAS